MESTDSGPASIRAVVSLKVRTVRAFEWIDALNDLNQEEP